jgi:hypothetical protein
MVTRLPTIYSFSLTKPRQSINDRTTSRAYVPDRSTSGRRDGKVSR